MRATLRRIVTGHNARGKSVVSIDGQRLGNAPGTRSGEIWMTTDTPADNDGLEDVAKWSSQLEPPTRGSLFRYVIIPAQDPKIKREEQEEITAKLFQSIGAAHCRVDVTRHAAMHVTRTIDYVVVLAGTVTLLLDEAEVQLKPCDVVVQRGTNHAWINTGSEPALLAAVLIDARPHISEDNRLSVSRKTKSI